jgi:hypothetical protein
MAARPLYRPNDSVAAAPNPVFRRMEPQAESPVVAAPAGAQAVDSPARTLQEELLARLERQDAKWPPSARTVFIIGAGAGLWLLIGAGLWAALA